VEPEIRDGIRIPVCGREQAEFPGLVPLAIAIASFRKDRSALGRKEIAMVRADPTDAPSPSVLRNRLLM
jgi:hypothetical protein